MIGIGDLREHERSGLQKGRNGEAWLEENHKLLYVNERR